MGVLLSALQYRGAADSEDMHCRSVASTHHARGAVLDMLRVAIQHSLARQVAFFSAGHHGRVVELHAFLHKPIKVLVEQARGTVCRSRLEITCRCQLSCASTLAVSDCHRSRVHSCSWATGGAPERCLTTKGFDQKQATGGAPERRSCDCRCRKRASPSRTALRVR